MFSFEGFSKLHITGKSVIIGLSIIMPFLYVDLYVFNPFLFNHNSIYLNIAYSYCMAVSYMFVVLLSTVIGMSIQLKKGEQGNIDNFMKIGIAICVFVLITCNIEQYLSDERKNLKGFLKYLTSVGAIVPFTMYFSELIVNKLSSYFGSKINKSSKSKVPH
jgi:hypothetical protein